jgi:uncharacterized DUF497 family protein
MAHVVVYEFAWDDQNLDKIAWHGLRFPVVNEIIRNPYVVEVNRSSRRAPYILIGQTENGDCIAVPIEPTFEDSIWRPVTAWRCKRSEWARLRQLRRRR